MKVPVSSLVLATTSERSRQLRAADHNDDGVISRFEQESLIQVMPLSERMALEQARRPGRTLGRDRALAAVTMQAAKDFAIFDRNQDGFIDGNEARSMSYELQSLVKGEWAAINARGAADASSPARAARTRRA